MLKTSSNLWSQHYVLRSITYGMMTKFSVINKINTVALWSRGCYIEECTLFRVTCPLNRGYKLKCRGANFTKMVVLFAHV